MNVETTVITSTAQVTADWLTMVFARSGVLTSGAVASFEITNRHSDNSRIVNLEVRYTPAARGDRPTALLLKMSGNEFGASEVNYFARDYADLPHAPIPRCYHAHYAPAQRAYHLLVDDLSATHRNNWDVMPTLVYGQAVAQALARLHAHYWNGEQLSRVDEVLPGAEQIERYIAHIRPGLAPLLDEMGTELDPTWQQALHTIFAHHPAAMLARTRNPRGITLVHGDLNPGNILSPRVGDAPVYLIDRQPFDWSLTMWLGVSDLAYMMVHWWDTELRRRYEWDVLRAYYAALVARGVTGYAWNDLARDYQLTAVQSVYVAVEWCVDDATRTAMKWLWSAQLEKAMHAYFDLRCEELF